MSTVKFGLQRNTKLYTQCENKLSADICLSCPVCLNYTNYKILLMTVIFILAEYILNTSKKVFSKQKHSFIIKCLLQILLFQLNGGTSNAFITKWQLNLLFYNQLRNTYCATFPCFFHVSWPIFSFRSFSFTSMCKQYDKINKKKMSQKCVKTTTQRLTWEL